MDCISIKINHGPVLLHLSFLNWIALHSLEFRFDWLVTDGACCRALRSARQTFQKLSKQSRRISNKIEQHKMIQWLGRLFTESIQAVSHPHRIVGLLDSRLNDCHRWIANPKDYSNSKWVFSRFYSSYADLLYETSLSVWQDWLQAQVL